MDPQDRNFRDDAATASLTGYPASEPGDPVIKPLLHRDERVLWRGRPSPRAAIRGNAVLNTAVALPFVAFAAFVAIAPGLGPQTLLFGAFFGFGLWQLSRPWRFYRLASRSRMSSPINGS